MVKFSVAASLAPTAKVPTPESIEPPSITYVFLANKSPETLVSWCDLHDEALEGQLARRPPGVAWIPGGTFLMGTFATRPIARVIVRARAPRRAARDRFVLNRFSVRDLGKSRTG